jgi:tetratricopeptide (TPR) repeat protein
MPIYAGINHAFEQDANGQHEAALRIMNEVVAEHAGNPEAWGQKAKLLLVNDRPDEAEEALQKAFDINPNYAFGLMLKAMLRLREGEVPGALILARRAAEAYSPEAHDYLADVYGIIFDCEHRLHRPVAAKAALRLVARFQPDNPEARNTLDELYGEAGQVPAAARRDYSLLSPTGSVTGARRATWDKAIREAGAARLSDLARLFDELTREDDKNAAAWFNLGLARAWLGENQLAVDALLRYLELEQDEQRLTTAGALLEVLRLGHGMEDQSDYVEYSFGLQFANPEPMIALLEEWRDAGRLIPTPVEQQGVFFALVLELSTAGVITVGGPAADVGRLAGYLMVAGNQARVWGPNKAAVGRLRETVRQRLALPLGEAQEKRGPLQFHDVVSDALTFPTGRGTPLTPEQVVAHAQKYYEETWPNQPRRALAGVTPADAAAQPSLRKRLFGIVQLIQDCAARGMIAQYDFNRLRRVLGLTAPAAPPAAPAGGATSPAPADLSALGTAELAGLAPETLSPAQLEQAYQAAQKHGADELSERFACALVVLPPQPDRPDRYPWYSFLTQRALRSGDTTAALDLVNEGEKHDCEHNEGRRRNDYELRRGQVHVKRGEVDAAQDVFQRLIDRVPANLKYRGTAAESMLTLKQGARALHFAEQGLVEARKQNDRDSEHYLMELAAAAKKLMG